MKRIAAVLPAVVLDWAGTTVDHGCRAPVVALQRVLARHGLPVTAAEARRGMGLPKRDHLRALLTALGSAIAVEEIYPELEAALFAELEPHSILIEGTLPFVGWLRAHGVRIGTTTGYTTAMMAVVASAASRQGYRPDAIVTPDQVGGGRPSAAMMLANRARLGLAPGAALVKIGDTPADVAEGHAAGAWTIGVALTGNALGLSAAETAALAADERAARFEAARASLREAGADYVADSLDHCQPVILEIFARARDGERPVTSP
jgi:phosphonoacetaldehyde hydrolase